MSTDGDQTGLPEKVSNSAISRQLKVVIGGLLIAILGSALWDFLFKAAFIAAGNFTLEAIASVWSGYVDVLHSKIGRLESDALVFPIYALVLVGFLGACLSMVIYFHNRIDANEKALDALELLEKSPVTLTPNPELRRLRIREQIASSRKMLNWQFTPLVCFFAGFVLIIFWQALYTRGASNWSERSIEILAPNIGGEEVVRLRSQLRRVSSAKEFYEFEAAIREHAQKHTVPLFRFSSIGNPVKY